MSNRTARSHTPINLILERNLTNYAIAASAAGVGLLALSQPSGAEIIFTPINQPISSNSTYPLDLNNDGIPDFTLSNFATTFALSNPQTGGFLNYLQVKGSLPSNQAARNNSYFAKAVKPQVLVGPGLTFPKNRNVRQEMEFCGLNNDTSSGPHYFGPWKNVQHRYLGLRFKLDGKNHFGWARLQVSVSHCRIDATLTGYAYETLAKKPIMTGDKGTGAGLGHLALGAAVRKGH